MLVSGVQQSDSVYMCVCVCVCVCMCVCVCVKFGSTTTCFYVDKSDLDMKKLMERGREYLMQFSSEKRYTM